MHQLYCWRIYVAAIINPHKMFYHIWLPDPVMWCLKWSWSVVPLLRQIPYLETTEQSTSVNLWLYISTLGYGQSKVWSCFLLSDKTYDRPTCNMGRAKKAGTVLLKSEFYVGPVIFFTVFLFSTECSSAQVEMFFQDLKSSVLNVFTHALTTQKISLLASQVFNTICL